MNIGKVRKVEKILVEAGVVAMAVAVALAGLAAKAAMEEVAARGVLVELDCRVCLSSARLLLSRTTAESSQITLMWAKVVVAL